MKEQMGIALLNHSLGCHYLSLLRDRSTTTSQFEYACTQLSTLLILFATSDLPLKSFPIETPVAQTNGHKVQSKLIAVPILRAGLGMVAPFRQLWPDLEVGHIGLERDELTAQASHYYIKLPQLEGAITFLLDPMLATGGSAVAALDILKRAGAGEIRFISIVAAPEGVALVQKHHPDVALYSAALDQGLTTQKYILPGLGDFGDRLYGTL